jgi:hypothetical protein
VWHFVKRARIADFPLMFMGRPYRLNASRIGVPDLLSKLGQVARPGMQESFAQNPMSPSRQATRPLETPRGRPSAAHAREGTVGSSSCYAAANLAITPEIYPDVADNVRSPSRIEQSVFLFMQNVKYLEYRLIRDRSASDLHTVTKTGRLSRVASRDEFSVTLQAAGLMSLDANSEQKGGNLNPEEDAMDGHGGTRDVRREMTPPSSHCS